MVNNTISNIISKTQYCKTCGCKKETHMYTSEGGIGSGPCSVKQHTKSCRAYILFDMDTSQTQ